MASPTASWASTLSAFVGTAGLMLGLVLFAVGFILAKRGVTTPVASLMLAITWLIPVAAGAAILLGMIGSFEEVSRLGPTVTPSDLAGGVNASFCQGGLALLGFGLGLVGSLRALAASLGTSTRAGDA